MAVPFFALMLAIMTVGLQYLTLHALDQGVAAASRKLRTGEAQKAGKTINDFRQLFCAEAGTFISCDGHLVIHIKNAQTFAGLMPLTQCLNNGVLQPSTGVGTDKVTTVSGNASSAVVVTACYDWEMGSKMWQTIWDVISPTPTTNGKTILSSTATFRAEPYQ